MVSVSLAPVNCGASGCGSPGVAEPLLLLGDFQDRTGRQTVLWISIPLARDLGWSSEVDKVFDNINAVFSQSIVCSSANCLGGGTKSNF